MRNLVEVIDQMIEVIPVECGNNPVQDSINNNLWQELHLVRKSCLYTAPEVHAYLWDKVFDLLTIYVKFPKTDWQYQVCAIFSGKSVEDLRKEFSP